MKRLYTMFILLPMAIYQPVRPPALTPADIPFTYDPNTVKSEILAYLEVRPSNAVIDIPIKATDPLGQYGTLTCSDPDVVIPAAVTTVDPNDPNGVSRIHRYACTRKVGQEIRILYEEFTFTNDPNGESYAPMSDSRTVLIDVRKRNRKPIISWGN